jgi:hypothetical protein
METCFSGNIYRVYTRVKLNNREKQVSQGMMEKKEEKADLTNKKRKVILSETDWAENFPNALLGLCLDLLDGISLSFVLLVCKNWKTIAYSAVSTLNHGDPWSDESFEFSAKFDQHYLFHLIDKFSHLRCLNVEYHITERDVILMLVSKMARLDELRITVPDQDILDAICNGPSQTTLKKLSCLYVRSDTLQFTCLEKLPELHYLGLHGCLQKNLETLRSVTGKLTGFTCEIDAHNLPQLLPPTSVTYLDLRLVTPLHEDNWNPLSVVEWLERWPVADRSQIKQLHLDGCTNFWQSSTVVEKFLSSMIHLKTVTLYNGFFTKSSSMDISLILSGLSACASSLQFLKLVDGSVRAEDENVRIWPVFPALRRLRFVNCHCIQIHNKEVKLPLPLDWMFFSPSSSVLHFSKLKCLEFSKCTLDPSTTPKVFEKLQMKICVEIYIDSH